MKQYSRLKNNTHKKSSEERKGRIKLTSFIKRPESQNYRKILEKLEKHYDYVKLLMHIKKHEVKLGK